MSSIFNLLPAIRPTRARSITSILATVPWLSIRRARRAQPALARPSRLPAEAQVTVDKRQLRTQLLHRLQTQKEENRRAKSEAIRRALSRLAAFRTAKTVLCYVSLPYEVETWRLIERMLAVHKRVVVPRVSGRHLLLSELQDPTKDLAKGAFGVWEPTRRAWRPARPDSVELVLVPGLAFDRSGHRLGHGLGYFDRFLASLPSTTPTIGLCFDFQLLDRLPLDPHDRAVWRVVSA